MNGFFDLHDSSAGSVFDVWATYDQCAHYPVYPVRTLKVGSSLELKNAERIVREIAREAMEFIDHEDLHSLRVLEIPLGRYAPVWEPLSERVYGRDGKLLDRRTSPADLRLFEGRMEEEIRFKKGDLCEVLDGDVIYLGFVVELPPSIEEAANRNAHGLFQLDATDDHYGVQTNAHHSSFRHVDSLRIFKPRHKIPAQTENRLRNAYHDYLTFPKRMKIADITAEARLRAIFEELGWTAEIAPPLLEDDSFKMKLTGVPGFPDGLGMEVDQKKAWYHMDRVRTAFLRLAGKPAEGRGYRLKPGIPGSIDRNGIPWPELDYPYCF